MFEVGKVKKKKKMVKEVSSAHQGCICLIKNTGKTVKYYCDSKITVLYANIC